MVNSIPTIITETSVTAVIHGMPRTVAADNSCYAEIVAALARGAEAEELEELFDKAKAISRYTQGKISVENGVIRYGEKVVDNYVCQKILSFMAQKLPYEALINFLERLLQNPSRRAIEHLYKFMEYGNLPITPEGKCLMYKAVRNDWLDHHSGVYRNMPGDVNEMPRNEVNDDPAQGCSYGFC